MNIHRKVDYAVKIQQQIAELQDDLNAARDEIRDYANAHGLASVFGTADSGFEAVVGKDTIATTIRLKDAREELGALLDPYLRFSPRKGAVKFVARKEPKRRGGREREAA